MTGSGPDGGPTWQWRAPAWAFCLLVFFSVTRPGLETLWLVSGLPPGPWRPLATMSVVNLALFAAWRAVAGRGLEALGLRALRQWPVSQRRMLVRGLAVAGLGFSLSFPDRLPVLFTNDRMAATVVWVLLPMLAWGFFQETLFRGMLQPMMTRRWGPAAGILASNSLFTFGPIHFHHVPRLLEGPEHAVTLAFVFAAGLLFAYFYHRHGNLWLVGLFHGIGNCFLDGYALIGRLGLATG